MAILAGATPQLPSASELAQLRVKLAGIIGEPNLQILEPAWVNLMREGVIVTLHAGRWRAEREFNLEELGVAARDNADGERLRKWFRLGSKRLLPARYLSRLDSLDTNARKWLTTCGMKTYWGTFVPADVYPRWKEAHQLRYEQPYFAERDEIYRNY